MPIKGEWNNPALRRCDGKASYSRWKIAESRAQLASLRIGELIVAYRCFDCGRIHIGHGDRSQVIARETASTRARKQSKIIDLPTVCPNCGGNIPDVRRQAAQSSGAQTVYCSRKCQQKGSRKARHAKRQASKTNNQL